MNQTKTLSFPTTSGEAVQSMIELGANAYGALKATTVILGTSYVGAKVTQTAYNKIIEKYDSMYCGGGESLTFEQYVEGK